MAESSGSCSAMPRYDRTPKTQLPDIDWQKVKDTWNKISKEKETVKPFIPEKLNMDISKKGETFEVKA